MTRYVVPAARVLTVVHLRDPHVQPQLRISGQADREWRARQGIADPWAVAEYTAESHTGRTVCGADMLVDETWISWQNPGPVPVCPQCAAGVPATDTQEALL